MKKIYINETEVESVTVNFTDLPKTSRPYDCRMLSAYLRRCKEREQSPAAELIADKRVLTQIGGIEIEPARFSFDLRADGVHLFAPSMLAELGVYAGRSGCTFELWAMIRDAKPAPAPAVSKGRIYYEGAGNIPGTIGERELLDLFKASRPCDRWIAMRALQNALEYHEAGDYEERHTCPTCSSRASAEPPRVIQFPGRAAGE